MKLFNGASYFFHLKTCQLLTNNMLIMVFIILDSLPVSSNMLSGNNPWQVWLVLMHSSKSVGDTSPEVPRWHNAPVFTLQIAYP